MKCEGKGVQKQRMQGERGGEVKEQPRGKVCNVVKTAVQCRITTLCQICTLARVTMNGIFCAKQG